MPAQVKRSPRKRMPKMTAVTKTLPSETPEISYERVRPKTYATDEKRAQALELFRHGIGYIRASRILDILQVVKRSLKAQKRSRHFS